MAQILLTSIITFSSSVHICQHHKPSTSPCSLHHVYPPATVPTHHLPTSLHPSSTSVCSSLQNVMRQRSRRKHGSGVLRGLLPTGKIVLIKKNLLSKCFGGVLAGWHGHWVDGWVNRLWGYESVLASGKKVSGSSKSEWQYLERSLGHWTEKHNGLFSFSALTEHFTKRVGCKKQEQLSQYVSVWPAYCGESLW